MEFKKFKEAVANQFAKMVKAPQLYRVDISGDQLWATYLASFPAGTNPIFRERTEHDCSCCKGFIRAIGNVVAIVDGKLVSLWDITVNEPAYQAVANALATQVRSSKVVDTFLHYEPKAGADKTFEELTDGQRAWDHFFVNIPTKFVKRNCDIATVLNQTRTRQALLARALRELRLDAIEAVLELIDQNSLYRGEEYKFAVSEFCKLHRAAPSDIETYAWEMSQILPASVTNIRNTSIGTLLVDLSDGMDMEAAVKKFEAMVAPANYKRPTALVTQAMINKAKEQLDALGLTNALERRYATLSDININDILFADRLARKSVIGGSLFDDVKPTKSATPKMDKIEEVPVEKFIKDILHRANTVEVMVENRHVPNFVSLIAPVDPTAGRLFKWDNPFSWSYNGEVADSIKERVKAAGGRIEGDLCCRLAWNNDDDLDFHMFEPAGDHIYYGMRGQHSHCGGVLDVDANGADGIRPNPVENIVYADKCTMKDGTYELKVHQFRQRMRENVGFEVEIEVEGQILTMIFDKAVAQSATVTVARITLKHGVLTIEPCLPCTAASKTVWGLSTQQFHPASLILTSPNHWDGQGIGNKHWFFMLEGAKNEGKARGFYNEFLNGHLDQHRKVLELIGSKTRVVDNPNQLSGLGFSSTQRNNLLCRITGNFSRTINIIF